MFVKMDIVIRYSVVLSCLFLCMDAINIDVNDYREEEQVTVHINSQQQQCDESSRTNHVHHQSSARVGKAGPRGEKGDKGEPGQSCDCVSSAALLERIKSLERELKPKLLYYKPIFINPAERTWLR